MNFMDFFYGSTNQLLRDERFCIDTEFFNRALKFRSIKDCKVIKVKLGDIYYENTPLKEVKPYLYLNGEIDAYKQYCQYHQSDLHINMSLDRYNRLIDSINSCGYNSKSIIIVTDNNKILDGQHRACILMHKYGEDYEIPVLYLKLKKRNLLQKLQKRIIKITKKFA